MSNDTRKILVVCTGNRARSQMAEGWLNHFGGGRLTVRSAGTEPKGVHPLAIELMNEAGVDLTGHTSEHVDAYRNEHFDVVVTVCDSAKEACPVFPNADRQVHQSFEDPDRPGIAKSDQRRLFTRIRDEIRAWAKGFAETV